MTVLAPLSLYVSALAGRPLGLRWHDEAHGLTYCDGDVIAVAAARGEAAWLDLTLQALLVRHGSLSARNMRPLLGRPTLARGYLACELARGITQARALVPRAALEHPALSQLPAPSSSCAASLQRAKELQLASTPAAWGVLMPLKVLARKTSATAPAESDAPAVELRDDDDDERELENSAILDAFRSPVASLVGPLGRLLSKVFDREPAERAASGEDGGDVGASHGAWASANAPGRALRGQARVADTAPLPARTLETSYPEWDVWAGRYRPDFVQVAQVEPDPAATLEPAIAASATPALRRALARFALGYESGRHQLQGDELVLDALVRLRVDLAAGDAGDPRIYRAPARTKRDLSALVLLDITGSTAELTAAGPRVFDRQLDFALSLAQALFASGDRTALYAFHSWGAKLVRVVRLLDFGERPGSSLLERARRVSPVGYSRLGAAIRHGAEMLRVRAGTPHRLLIVVTDALAYDRGYEGAYAHADTRRALAEARGENTACVCLSIGASTDGSTLDQVFGGSCFLALPDLHGHERDLRRLFESALTEVTRRAARTRPVRPTTPGASAR